jgi:hypothetical protein
MTDRDGLWRLFRRLLLGCVVEALLDSEVDVDIRSLELHFKPESVFHVPRLDNYMKFFGHVRGALRGDFDDARRERLKHALQAIWPEIVTALDIPVGDRLTVTQNQLDISVHGGQLTITFDLAAD